MSLTETDNLAQLIERRHACLNQLRELVCRQRELIGAGELTHLLTVLAAKQRLLSELTATERALDPFRQQDPAARQWSSAADREHCARLAADCQSLLAEIVTQEQDSEAEMNRRRQATVESLEHVHTAGAARGAYAAGAEPQRSQLDLSSER
jgi:flagellar biosynthesis/type III secretory pathway chaperone